MTFGWKFRKHEHRCFEVVAAIKRGVAYSQVDQESYSDPSMLNFVKPLVRNSQNTSDASTCPMILADLP